MEINNFEYGGFIVSNNVIVGRPIRYTFREKSEIAKLNGWTIYSYDDDDEYVNDANNFQIVGGNTIFKLAPVMLEIFKAPYGTDLCWLYEDNVHTGFYDLKSEKEKRIKQILESE